MASKKRTGLGRGLSALIPSGSSSEDRDIDVFFDGSAPSGRRQATATTTIDAPLTEDTVTQDTVPSSASEPESAAAAKKTAPKRTTTKSTSKGTSKTSTSKETTSKTGAAKASTAKPAGARKAASTADDAVANGSIDIDATAAFDAMAPTEPGVATAEDIGAAEGATSAQGTAGDAAGSADDMANPVDAAATELGGADADVADAGAAAETTTSEGLDDAEAQDVEARDADAQPDETELLPVPGATLRTLDPMRIVPNARQPRHEFDQDALDELIISVREFGVLQPIVVRPLPEGDPRRADGDYELIMGERRLRATKASGRDHVPAIVRDTDDDDMLRDALLENLHRAELNPLEEASAYRQLLDDFGCTQDELAERIGRSRPRISNTLRLLNLPVDVQRRVAAGVLSAGHARAVLSVGEPAAMTQLADRIVNEQLSVRESETAAATLATRAGRGSRGTKQQDAPGTDSLSAHLEEVGERLGDRFNTRVKVVLRKTKGTITIDFASMADLNRILEDLGEADEA